jgi:hypothetical protein
MGVVQRRIFSLVFPLALASLRSSSPDLQQPQALALGFALEPGQVWALVLRPLLCLPAVAFLLALPPWVHLLLAWLVLSTRYRVRAVLLE